MEDQYYKKIVIGADVRKGMIASHGWNKQSNIRAVDLIKKFNPSIISAVIYTDISRDGSLQGVSLGDTINFAKDLNTYSAQFCVTTPFPGTRFFEDNKNKLIHHHWSKSYKLVLRIFHDTCDLINHLLVVPCIGHKKSMH